MTKRRINKQAVDLLMATGYKDLDAFADQWAREQALLCELQRRSSKGNFVTNFFSGLFQMFRRKK